MKLNLSEVSVLFGSLQLLKKHRIFYFQNDYLPSSIEKLNLIFSYTNFNKTIHSTHRRIKLYHGRGVSVTQLLVLTFRNSDIG